MSRAYASIVDEDGPSSGTAPSANDDLTEPGPGRRLGRYELVRLLGAGGMANVYLARAEGPGGFAKLFAVKCIHSFLARDKRFVSMFLDEARISALVSHPNVAQVFELGEDRGIHFLAMELLHGEHLGVVHARALRTVGLLPYELTAAIVGAAAEGLHQAHETLDPEGRPLEVVHRDVSPQNVFVTYDGLVKVTDFGIAKAANRLVETDTGSVKGKFGYMAPEQALGMAVDRRTDVFALGVVLWELLTGKRLFRAPTSAETILNVTRCEVAPPTTLNPACPPGLESIALRALSREVTDRYPSAAAMAEDLASWLRSEPHVPHDRARVAAFVSGLFPERAANRPLAGSSARELPLPPTSEDARPLPVEPSHSGVRPGSSASLASAPTERLDASPVAAEPSIHTASPHAVPPVTEPSIVLPTERTRVPLIVAGATLMFGVAVAVGLVVTRENGVAAPSEGGVVGAPHERTRAHPSEPPPPPPSSAPATAGSQAEPDSPTAAPDPTLSPAASVHPRPTPITPAAPESRTRTARVPAAAPSVPAGDTIDRWGYLNLITTPWARVWIDGQPAGVTPLYRRRVTVGAHAIELRAEGTGPSRTVRVRVGDGETVSRRLDLASP